MKLPLRTCAAALTAAVATMPLSAAPSGTDFVTKVWRTSVFPERERARKPMDFGVAFSGGGTRSAAATLGQLRALRALGWLPKIGYISAVSGGSWSAVPFTFTDETVDDRLLGSEPELSALTPEKLALTLNGSLANAISDSRLVTCAAFETSRIVGVLPQEVGEGVAHILGRCEYGDADAGTYSRLLSSIFLRTTTNLSSGDLMAWDPQQVEDVLDVNPNLDASRFALAGDRRPFLIVNATVMRGGPDGRELTPIEMTPFYTGVRHYHRSIGGTYIWSWAFDSEGAVVTYDDQSFVRIRTGAQHQGLTPADMMAASGAAPLNWILAHLPSAISDRAVGYFPHFTHFTTADDGRSEAAQRNVLHGDGGFLDNVGLMPLLARHVHNIIAFVNTKAPLIGNKDISSYFDRPGGSSADDAKVNNVVFDRGKHGVDRYQEVVNGLKQQVSLGRGAVYCGRNFTVVRNQFYGIEPYDGVNVCFVYNYHPLIWWDQLPGWLQGQIAKPALAYFTGEETRPKGTGVFTDFPWYNTFFEDIPSVVYLKPEQTNLLADMAYWIVDDQREMIEHALITHQ